MSTIRNILFMGTSTAIRLGCGMLTFVVMARQLGPEMFGMIMFWLSISTLITMVANFGLTPYLLREMGANPDNADEVMNQVFSIKLLLSFFVVTGSLISLVWVSESQRMVFMCILMALLFDSITEFLNVGFRATNRFSAETRIASITALLQFIIVSSLLFFYASIHVAALGFLVSRAIAMILTWVGQKSYFTKLRPSGIKQAFSCARTTITYAIDYFFQSLFGQIDSLLLNYFIGPTAVGIYQAGMRVFLGGAQAAPVLANVFLPKASAVASSSDTGKFAKEVKNIQLVFILFGLLFGISLAGLSHYIVKYLFGSSFTSLEIVFPWLGLLFFIRFFASAWGMILTSAGLQTYRTKVNALQWIICLALTPVLMPMLGTIGWIICLSLGQLILGLGYFIKGVSLVKPTKSMLILSILGFLVFYPFLKLA